MMLQEGEPGTDTEIAEHTPGVFRVLAESRPSCSVLYESRSLRVNSRTGTTAQKCMGEKDVGEENVGEEHMGEEQLDQRLEYTSSTEEIPEDMRIRLHPEIRDGPSQTLYKSEPDNVYTYSYEDARGTLTKHTLSRKVQDTSIKPPKGSKVPVVCLERLKVLVSRCSPQGRQNSAPPDDSRLKFEDKISQEQVREHCAEEGQSFIKLGQSMDMYQLPCDPSLAEDFPCNLSPVDSESSIQEICNKNKYFSGSSTEPVYSSDPEPLAPENSSDPNPSEPGSVSHVKSAPEANFDSDAELESEIQVETEPSVISEPQLESDPESDLESEQLPELSVESEQELESDPDSTAEVTLNLEQDCEWEAEQVSTVVNLQEEEEVGVAERECVDIESEDFCAVCSIGGELLCCDRCPKVFHLTCHVPTLLRFPTGDWACTLCRDDKRAEVEYDCEDTRLPPNLAPSPLPQCDLRKCEKLTLLIYSNILSAPFHEPVSPLARHYYQIIKRPMDLSVIRSRLDRKSSSHYGSVQEFISDVLLMFKNCAKFNYPDSEVAQAGHNLRTFFLSKVRDVFPDLNFPTPDDDSEHGSDDDDNNDDPGCSSSMVFSWTERREQIHRKRKRRRSLGWKRRHY